MKAFKENAIDYLEKPINIDDLINAIAKAKQIIETPGEQNEALNAIIQKALKMNDSAKVSIPTSSLTFDLVHTAGFRWALTLDTDGI